MMAAVLTIVLLAAPSEAVSRAHFAKAQKSFTQHDWRHALDEFTAASESSPTELPDLWFDIAQCHRNLGHARLAVAAFERYLSLKPDAPDRDKVRALIVSLGGKPPPAEEPAPAAPVATPAPIEPSPAVVDAKPDVSVAARPALPLVPTSDAPPARRNRHWKVWTGVAVGVAVAALGVGLGVGLGTSSHSSSTGTSLSPTPSLGTGITFDTRGH
jgi:tetratricopeptide (TPR) repeat protein